MTGKDGVMDDGASFGVSSTSHDQGSKEKAPTHHEKPVHKEAADTAAEKGHLATDQYGHSLVDIDPAVEARLRRKIDFYVVPTVVVLYLFCFVDRANIGKLYLENCPNAMLATDPTPGNARLAGLEQDLGLTGYGYNQIVSCFYISYIILELPAVLLCKWMGPGWFIPATSLGFGVMTLAFAWVSNIETACAVRVLLGAFEAGMLPGIAYYLSRWYRRSELAFRLGIYIAAAPLAGALSGLLASGILKLDNFGSTKRWEMIFAVEGVITIGVAVVSFFTLTDRPETARWLSAEEKYIAIARIKSERIGTTEVLDKMDKAKLLRGIVNPMTLGTSFYLLMGNVTVQGLGFFLPTIVRTIYPQASVIRVQLLCAPPYFLGAVTVVVTNWLSWKLDRRNIIMILSAPTVMTGYAIFLGTTNQQARYGATFLITLGAFNGGALSSAHVSANVVSDTARSSAIAWIACWGNLGGLISTWSFLPFDGPNYPIGNGLGVSTSSMMLLVTIAMAFYIKTDNRRREKVDVNSTLQNLSHKQIQDLDWKHPGFRWKG